MDEGKMLQNQHAILAVEQRQEDLSRDRRLLEENLFQLQGELQRGFAQLTELNREGVEQGAYAPLSAQEANELKQRAFQRLLEQANEEIDSSYQQAIQELETEREALYDERRNFSWD